MNNINYNTEMENLIKTFDCKKTLLLHSCCGPCSTAVITRLKDYFDITVFYYNPCLYPDSEYEKRLHEQIKFIEELNATLTDKIKIIVPDYLPDTFIKKTVGMESEPEGGARCKVCYADRIGATFEYANTHNYQYFGTTLSVSPYKHSDWLNEIGLKLENEKTKYLVSDFKKKDGYKLSLDLSKKYHLYRQNYCGCKFSYLSMLEREQEQNNINNNNSNIN